MYAKMFISRVLLKNSLVFIWHDVHPALTDLFEKSSYCNPK